MLNKKKVLSIASAGVALIAIAGSAFADTATTPSTDATQQTSNQVQVKHDHSNQELLTLLGIDSATLKQDFKAGQSLADIASSKGVDEQKVIDLFVNQQTQRIDQAVQKGKLTQDKATQREAKLQDQVKKMVEHKGGFGGEHRRGQKDGSLKEVATILGTTPQDLQTQLKAGQTIAQIAQSKGIAETDLINQLLQKDKDRLTKMVEKSWQKGDHQSTDGNNTVTNSTVPSATYSDSSSSQQVSTTSDGSVTNDAANSSASVSSGTNATSDTATTSGTSTVGASN